jgi:hypothetical protein
LTIRQDLEALLGGELILKGRNAIHIDNTLALGNLGR